jgi:hypothetical protein
MDSGEHDGEAEVSARKALTKMARLERQDKANFGSPLAALVKCLSAHWF